VNADKTPADQFEAHHGHLRAVAYRMLGSVHEVDDAVQEGWLRLSRSDSSEIDNLGGWLTTVVARVCLDMLRSRTARREDALDSHEPEAVIADDDAGHPEREALLADSVGVAMLVVLDRLAPAERLAFVLYDMFAVPVDELGSIMARSSTAARQLASRGRRRVQAPGTTSDVERTVQREVVHAQGTKVTYKGGEFTVTDGPFAEAKELIGGWALMEVRDRDEAIEWTKRFLSVAGEGESTIRRVF